VVGSADGRSRITPALRAANLAVSGADVGMLLRARADATIDTETDLVLSPRRQSQIEAAEALRARLVICWIGNNDALGAVTNFDHLDGSQLTPIPKFAEDFHEIVSRLKAAGSTPIFGNIPDVVDIAFLMDRQDLIRFLGSDFGLPAGSFTTLAAVAMVKLGLENPSIFQDPDFVLDPAEIGLIRNRIDVFNAIIRDTAEAEGFAVVDTHAAFRLIAALQPVVFGVRLTSRYLGGLFSLDGIHPSNFSHALIAASFISTLNTRYGLSLPSLTLSEWLAVFLADPFIDKDGDGRVTGRFGAGLLETILPFLGISGDPNDFSPDAAGQSLESSEAAVQMLEQTWGAHIPRADEPEGRAAVAAVKRLFGIN